ncbi:MAG: hypothetical protein AAF587_18425 [Bacteroidota bacterium]
MRIWLIFFVSLFIIGPLFAQKAGYEDVIYLKNGSVIRGEIVEQEVRGTVKIVLLGGSILVYEQSDIEIITQEPSIYREIIRQRNKRFRRPFFRQQGVTYGIGFQFLSHGSTWNWRLDPALSLRIGYRFKPQLEVGGSTGIHMYSSGLVIPAYVFLKGQQAQKKFALAYMAEAGTGVFGISTQFNTTAFRPSLAGQLGGGLAIHTTKRLEWWLLVSYKFQRAYLRREWPDPFGREPTISEQRIWHQGINYQIELAF